MRVIIKCITVIIILSCLASCSISGKQLLNSFVDDLLGNNNNTTASNSTLQGYKTNATNKSPYENKNKLKGVTTIDNVKYEVYEDGHAVLKSIENYIGDKFIIPDEVPYDYENYKVTEVGGFYKKKYLKTIVFGKNVKTIKEYAFAECTNLFYVTFNDNIERIGDYAFENTPFRAKLGPSVKYIGQRAFHNAGLPDLSEAISLEYIGSEAFYCEGSSPSHNVITLPNSVRHIGNKAFYGRWCANIPNNIESIEEEGLPLLPTKWVLPTSLRSLGYSALGYSSEYIRGTNKKYELIVPNGTAMREFDITMFPYCSSISLGNGIKKVKKSYRERTSASKLEEIIFPSTLEEIEDNCFANLKNLSSVTGLDNSCLKRIGTKAFYGTSLTRVTIPETVVEIGEQAFENSPNLREVVFKGSPKMIIKKGAFAFCPHLLTPSVPAGVTLEKGVFFKQ